MSGFAIVIGWMSGTRTKSGGTLTGRVVRGLAGLLEARP